MSKSTVKRTLNKEEKEVVKNKSRRKTENIMNKTKSPETRHRKTDIEQHKHKRR